MSALLLALPGAEQTAATLAPLTGTAVGTLESRRFPDGEIYLRVDSDVRAADLVLVADLYRPDPQLPTLLFLSDLLHELGARRIGLVTPYLPYMRQDTRFHPGEAITSRTFAALLSGACDWLVTVDPHLHRYASLSEIYRIPTHAVSATPAIAAWVAAQVPRPFVIGPDAESAQWAAEVARLAGCGHAVLEKHRHGDRDVEMVLPDLAAAAGCTPVLIDDIISSARTMAVAVRSVRAAGLPAPVCVGVHALFAGDAEAVLAAAGAARVVTCNTVPHPGNAIDVLPDVAAAVRKMLAG